ncbi:MAG TPA: glutamine synthetase beta-grasp domain-containing protein, partial [Actinomycetota bacterium]|nr:glutamine synthetase beta-grasp domain-containing protein [Actinomycetota bacterium]
MDAAAVVREVQERRVPLVRLWFTDVLGFLKSFAVPAEELERALSDGIGFDGSAIEGFARVEEEDVIARPDPVTFRLLPARGGDVAARMLCDITYPDGAPFEGDPRFVLRRNLERARALGYRFVAAPEIEFFLSRSAEQFDPADRGGYFDLTASDVAEAFRRRTLDALGALGIAVESVHHEDAPGQQEIDLA